MGCDLWLKVCSPGTRDEAEAQQLVPAAITRAFVLCAQAPVPALFPGAPGGGGGKGERQPPRAGSFTMEETTTANLTLNMSYGSEDLEQYLNYSCSTIRHEMIGFACVCLGVSLCGLVGNGLVVWFLGFHMKQSPFTVYILNLAVADFSMVLLLFLILLALFILLAFCASFLYLAPLYEDFVFGAGLLCHMFDLCSLGLLTALSVERCVSVQFPVWYRCHRPRHLSGIVCGALWALAALCVSLLYVTLTISEHYGEVLSGLVVVFSLILVFLMLISNLFLCSKLCRGSQRRYPGRLFFVVLLNVIIFFAFGIPFCLDVFPNLPSSGELFPEDDISLLLALLDCCLNPVSYILVGSCRRGRFCCSIKVALRRVFEEKTGSEEGSHEPGDTVVGVTSL
ncbi:mas-related G-protein coupled receptor member H-like protein [Willisornis vidua]|uniref:Mas-related G-protein coupled receptor member H-like protein n=1 Tax=Willisornis vidua TaxID=1566151 RepID=A0ABQ9DM84_9PASS|nr:mas-related G-protein coupled receptor member H-like protein [Willisornis vidua]KAJ7424911.1 mas-related G-protein coupled receptor member H-like protein [Willisornis vidua]